MSEQNATAAAEEQKQTDVLVGTSEHLDFYMGEFEKGVAKGLKYIYPRVKSGAAADAAFGTEIASGVLNARLKTLVASRVKLNVLPDTGSEDKDRSEIAKLVALHPDGVIFSLDDAQKFRPGLREPGLKDQLAEAQKIVMDAVLKGESPSAEAIAKVKELLARVEARKAAAESEE